MNRAEWFEVGVYVQRHAEQGDSVANSHPDVSEPSPTDANAHLRLVHFHRQRIPHRHTRYRPHNPADILARSNVESANRHHRIARDLPRQVQQGTTTARNKVERKALGDQFGVGHPHVGPTALAADGDGRRVVAEQHRRRAGRTGHVVHHPPLEGGELFDCERRGRAHPFDRIARIGGGVGHASGGRCAGNP